MWHKHFGIPEHFNPLPPHGGRLPALSTGTATKHFNPLPPHGGRLRTEWSLKSVLLFQSTPSAWRETETGLRHTDGLCISIHSLRMEGDMRPSPALPWYGYFNPLPPHGGRRIHIHTVRRRNTFQSTPSAWRETVSIKTYPCFLAISIHSLRMEGDGGHAVEVCEFLYFNPLPPHGGRPLVFICTPICTEISIHSLRMEGDLMSTGK